jgi:hypothetical protein
VDLSNKILFHLKHKGNKSADLNEIIMAMYEEEIKEITVLSENVLKTLADLRSKGMIKEYFDEDGKLCYDLMSSDNNHADKNYIH